MVAFQPASALIFFGTADPAHNTSAPTGPLAGSGWQYEGQWGSGVGTAIAPNFFISARHLGGSVGESFVLSGLSYKTVASYEDPEGDLKLWKIAGSFPVYASLYEGSDETGKQIVVFGRGRKRGAEVVDGCLRGWRWGDSDGVMRWGTNVVTGIVDGGPLYGRALLGSDFDPGGGGDEATVAEGDSGGGGFILEGGVWKLAGVISWVDGPYSKTLKGRDAFMAAMFDETGYFYDSLSSNGQVTEPGRGPGSFFLSRISSRLGWIFGIIGK